MWFEDLTGFAEISGEQVREHLLLDGEYLTSSVNGRSMRCGRLETPSLHELVSADAPSLGQPNTIREVVADVRQLHRTPQNEGALFQVASQFNLLEMASPAATPELGVGIYENDPTQGPACAVTCGAGTIFRNWFAETQTSTGVQAGQSAEYQIDCLAYIGVEVGNSDDQIWSMENGYGLATASGLVDLAELLADEAERTRLAGVLRIGLQLDTEVTAGEAGHHVSQAYCSAMPIGYSPHSVDLWEPFARLVLDAAYEATLLAAANNAAKTGNRRVFLTLLGGGVFANPIGWILDAIERALARHQDLGLDIAIVSYGGSSRAVDAWLNTTYLDLQ